MSKRESYETRTEELLTPILERLDFELVDVEYVKEGGTWYLRAYIDKEGGITINDCEMVAREMNEILDREDFVEDSYVFEVSSPGLGRPLKKEKDYIRSMGKKVELRTEMNEILDREDFVEDSYVFEVSSPGLGRPLKKEKDYIRSMGKKVELRTYRAINREKEFYGILAEYDAATVTIEQENGIRRTFEKSDLALIRLAFD